MYTALGQHLQKPTKPVFSSPEDRPHRGNWRVCTHYVGGWEGGRISIGSPSKGRNARSEEEEATDKAIDDPTTGAMDEATDEAIHLLVL